MTVKGLLCSRLSIQSHTGSRGIFRSSHPPPLSLVFLSSLVISFPHITLSFHIPSYVNSKTTPTHPLWFSIHPPQQNCPIQEKKASLTLSSPSSVILLGPLAPFSTSAYPPVAATQTPGLSFLHCFAMAPIVWARKRKLGGMKERKKDRRRAERVTCALFWSQEGSTHIRVWKFCCSFLLFSQCPF